MNLLDRYVNNTHRLGFTLVELLLTIAIVSIVSAGAAPFLSNFIARQNHFTLESNTVSALQKAQAYALAQKNGETWGVCNTGSVIRLYAGNCSSPTYQEDYQISTATSVSGISDITFGTTGNPSSVATISIQTNNLASTIYINEWGTITQTSSTVSPSPTPTSSPSPAPTPSPTATPTPSPSPSPSGDLTATVSFDSQWATGFCLTVTITNTTSNPITGWTVILSQTNYTPYNTWGGNFSSVSNQLEITPLSYNQTIPANNSINNVGFCANTQSGFVNPTVISVTNPTPSPSPSPSPTPNPIGQYEGEDYTSQFDVTIDTNHAGYSGTGFANYGGNGSYVEWNTVDEGAGNTTLTFTYANGSGGDRPTDVYVNGTPVTTVAFSPTGAWTSWTTVSTTVTLNPGNNTIRVTANSSAGGPNLDKMEVENTSSNPLNASIAFTSDWGSGFCIEAIINNSSATPITGWTLVLSKSNYTITSSWAANYSETGSQVEITPLSYNETIAANGSVSGIGFCANRQSGAVNPTILSVN